MPNDNALFIPLKSEHFRAFASGSKTIEWRKLGARFNHKTLTPLRSVTLSNGYSGERLFGHITQLELRAAEDVGPVALALYKTGTMLVGIHIQLHDFTPRRMTSKVSQLRGRRRS